MLVAEAGQTVGSVAGQKVACLGHWVVWIGQTVTVVPQWVTFVEVAHWVIWPVHSVGGVAPVHWVMTFGQVVRLTGHSVVFSGHVVRVTGHSVGTPAGQWVAYTGHCVAERGHSVGTVAGHSVAFTGQWVA